MDKIPVDNLKYLKGNPLAKVEWDPNGIPYNAAIPVRTRKMQLVIPTHGRPDRQITLRELTPNLQATVLLVTSLESDAVAIRKNYKSVLEDPKKQVISIEKYYTGKIAINGIAKKRQWLVENLGCQAIFQMDDDMWRYARCETKYRDLVPERNGGFQWKVNEEGLKAGVKLIAKGNLTDEYYDEILAKLSGMLCGKNPEYVHAGISSRMGNNQVPFDWKYVTRAMHSIGHRRDILIRNGIKFDDVFLKEDFYVTLRLLEMGYPNAICYDVCVSPADYGAEGGAAQERTIELANEQAEKLASLFPGFVKVVYKEYSYSVPRKEVQISWNKIFESNNALRSLKTKKSLF